MKPNRHYSDGPRLNRREAGVTLLDVVLAIAVFAFGMLALVQLQGNVTRSSADSNTRTVAAGIAEELVESLRAYRSIQADPDNGLWDYQEIDSDALDVQDLERGGIQYDLDVTVSNFWWDAVNETFIRTETTEPPEGLNLVYADFKLLRLDVSWDDRENYVDDANTADLGSGSVTVYEIIPSAPPSLGARLAAALDDGSGLPVNYSPGENPEVIRLSLGQNGNRFKESSMAQPKVIHDDYVETWFDVVTYSQAPSDQEGLFLRREEFVAISCLCELQDTPDDPNGYGLTPTLWNGASYTEGVPAAKPVGTPVKNLSQSAFCDICCRDHHDVDSWEAGRDKMEQVYDLANASGDAGDHAHYNRVEVGQGSELVGPVVAGGEYEEACRLVRKDGFMRVTHDASQKTLIGFPEGYLELDDGASAYSAYATDAVEEYYDTYNQTTFPQPAPSDGTPATLPARDPAHATNLPTATLALSQQMSARSIYTDYLTQAAKDVINDCFTENPPLQTCAAPNAVTEMEIYPFFDLKMTYLASWVEETASGQVDVSSQGIDNNNPYSRGFVEYVSGTGQVQVAMRSEAGNLGLTATPEIDLAYQETMDTLYVDLYLDDTPAPPIGQAWTGTLSSSVRRVSPSDLTFAADGAICGNTLNAWSCVVPSTGASLVITGYYLNNPKVYVCSSSASLTRAESVDGRTTTFTLPASGGTADIYVTDTGCGP